VNGYVEGVMLRNLHVEGASSTGIYLEAGSKNCIVENSTIVNNGFGENSPAGGRNNTFQSNTAGGACCAETATARSHGGARRSTG
jgi:hypothetical protein